MFMKGQLKIKGNVMLAQKLGKLFKEVGKSSSSSSSSTTTSGGGKNEAITESGMVADKIFEEMSIKLREKPDLAKSINAIYAFQITKDNVTKNFGTIFRNNL
jgi:hypothetical protein